MRKSSLKSDLQHIISLCKNSSGTFAAAAGTTKTNELKNTLSLIALQRKSYCEVLRQEARKEGINLSLADSFGRSFANFFSTILKLFISNTKDDYRIIEACRAKEERLADLYDYVLTNEDLPINLYKLMVEHQRLVRNTVNEQLFVPMHA